jgi:phage shock protein A
MPDEPTPAPDPPDEDETVDDLALQPDTAPTSTPAAAPAEPAATGYTPSGVPTFESVREKIETRYGTAIGASELAAETPEGRTVEEQYEERQKAAAERLEQIRKSMHDDADQNENS